MIFLLEDDDSIRKLVEYALNAQNMECKGFALPSAFWSEMQNTRADLILLDIMLPEEDGICVLKTLKSSEKTKHIPVIMLTAKTTEYDTVLGLESGADDYIAKPFGIMELVARIKAVLRRYEAVSAEKDSVLECGKIRLSKAKHQVFCGENEIFLTVKEFDLLCILLENRGNIITREQLLSKIWKTDIDVETRTVDVHIRYLRKKLNDENIIETIRGVGYRIK
ncbi:winged helix-turn-helix domain-containing protein [Treponema zioleckii]|uniref:winged helix-turn-helix domain-containing protein n=1 Tax=Treponema zioleckii TaxID=331680 RepID=UPI00168BBCD2|nr:response regulator transcription factor [Treponema zioleckii]